MAEEKKYKKPIPRIDEENKPFWEAYAGTSYTCRNVGAAAKSFTTPAPSAQTICRKILTG